MDDVGVKPTIFGKTLHILSSKKIIPTIRNHLQRWDIGALGGLSGSSKKGTVMDSSLELFLCWNFDLSKIILGVRFFWPGTKKFVLNPWKMLVGILSFWLLVLGETTRHKLALCICILHWHQYLHSLKSTHSLNVGNPKRNGKAHHLPTNEFQQPAGSGASLLFVSGMETYQVFECFCGKSGLKFLHQLIMFIFWSKKNLSSSNCSILHIFSVGLCLDRPDYSFPSLT